MLYYAIGLLLIFFVCLIGEFFLPSAGMIGIAALLSAVGTIICGFSHSMSLGITMTGIVGISTPLVLMFMIKIWPHTPIGRRILNRRPGQVDEAPPERVIRDGTPLSQLVGKIGVAKTDLLPSGRVMLQGHKLDAISLGSAIDAGSKVIVVKISAGKIHVKKAPAGLVESDFDMGEDQSPNPQLSQSAEQADHPSAKTFDLDSLE